MRDYLEMFTESKQTINESGVPMTNIPVKVINTGFGDHEGKMIQVNGSMTADSNGAPMLVFDMQGQKVYAQFKNGGWVADMD